MSIVLINVNNIGKYFSWVLEVEICPLTFNNTVLHALKFLALSSKVIYNKVVCVFALESMLLCLLLYALVMHYGA